MRRVPSYRKRQINAVKERCIYKDEMSDVESEESELESENASSLSLGGVASEGPSRRTRNHPESYVISGQRLTTHNVCTFCSLSDQKWFFSISTYSRGQAITDRFWVICAALPQLGL